MEKKQEETLKQQNATFKQLKTFCNKSIDQIYKLENKFRKFPLEKIIIEFKNIATGLEKLEEIVGKIEMRNNPDKTYVECLLSTSDKNQSHEITK